MTVFDNRKALWQWMFSQQAEQTLAEAAATARDLAGADILLVKVMDGLDWMRRYDPTGYASLTQFQVDAIGVAAGGVTVVPWVVPHGQDPLAEAAAHAQLGPVLMVDVEPYAGFWTGPPANLPIYLQALRAGGVSELHISVDPRLTAIAALGGVPAALVDGIHPQCYWTDFKQPALTVLPMIQALVSPSLAGKGPGVRSVPVYPVMPGNGAAGDLADVWQAAQAAGCTGVSVWRLGSMDSTQLENFRSLAMVTPAPDPQPALEDRVTALEAQLARLNAVLVNRFHLAAEAFTYDVPDPTPPA